LRKRNERAQRPSPTLFYDLPLALDKKASLALKGGGPLAVEGYILYI